MYIHVGGLNLSEMFPVFLIILIGIMVAALLFLFFLKRQDNNKELISQKVRILEKPIQQGSIEWYVVECENGERLKLRNFKADSIIISVGDVGIISYKGKTIQSFQRK